jgi:O-antigen/teichoic acid export membrane protein
MFKKLKVFISWNALSLIVQVVIALLCLPIYLKLLSSTNMAIVTLIWSTISLSYVLDLGFTRIVTQKLSASINNKEKNKLKQIISNNLIIVSIVSLVVSIATSLIFLYYITSDNNKIKIDNEIMVHIFINILIIIYFNILSTFIIGVFDGLQKIEISSIVRIISSVTFIGIPALILKNNPLIEIQNIFILMSILKISLFILLLYMIKKYIKKPSMTRAIKIYIIYFQKARWVIVTNFCGSILNQIDRFIIPLYCNSLQLINFSIASDLIQRGISLLGIISSSVFPLISGKKDIKTEKYAEKIISILTIMGLITSYIIIDEFIDWWLSGVDIENIGLLFKIMLIGWAASGYGLLYLNIIQSKGRMEITGKLHIIEVILFVPIIYFLIINYGVIGAAIGWNIRVIFDSFALKIISNRLSKY